MAEPFGIATGIIGLLPFIRDGFVLITDVFRAENDLELALGRVELQKGVFESWEHGWEDDSGTTEKNFEEFEKLNQRSAQRVFQQLALLVQACSDADNLKKRYGLESNDTEKARKSGMTKDVSRYDFSTDKKFSKDAIETFKKSCHVNLTFFKKARFVMTDKKTKLEELISLLKEFNDNLKSYTSAFVNNLAFRRTFELFVISHTDPDRSQRMAAGAAYEAKHSTNQQAKEHYGDMAKFEKFVKAVAGKVPHMSPNNIFKLKQFSFDRLYRLSGNSTLALFLDRPETGQSRLVLIEWISTKSGSADEKLEEAKKLWHLLYNEKPEKLLVPKSYGIVHDDTDLTDKKLGIVLVLPHHIRANLPTKVSRGAKDTKPANGTRPILSPETIAKQRMPTNLRQLIKDRSGLDLGIRFQLAKKLIDALHLIHCAGWTHKNIRSDIILFFPTKGENGDPNPKHLGFDEPVFVGFNNARLEIVHITEGDRTTSSQSHNIILDCYQHPDKRQNITVIYRQYYDLYSLGCVLLEIGLWKTLEDLANVTESSYGNKDNIKDETQKIQHAAERLDRATGSIYGNVVRRCLALGSKHLVGDISVLERDLAATLAQCVA